MTVRLHVGDCREVMATLDADSVDAVVTDPPAGIAFMSKHWDSDKGGRDVWVAWLTGVMREAFRVAKPGAHAVVWALPRTSGWTHRAIEDAGWEIRDCLTHHFGSGFPKSLNVGDGRGTALKPATEFWYLARKPLIGTVAANVERYGTGAIHVDACRIGTDHITAHGGGNNVEGRTYGNGKGIPAIESGSNPHVGRWPANVILSHVPCDANGDFGCREVGTKRVKATVAGSFQREMTSRGYEGGGLGQRRAADHDAIDRSKPGYGDAEGMETVTAWECIEGCPVALLDAQSGERKTGAIRPYEYNRGSSSVPIFHSTRATSTHEASTGGASRFFLNVSWQPGELDEARFFYTAKASTSERNKGLEGMAASAVHRYGAGIGEGNDPLAPVFEKNHHPTVKPLSLMTWLVKLVTPPGGTVLDPFAGSGTTLIAADRAGFNAIGIEQDPEYAEIARQRVVGDSPLFAMVEVS